MKKVLILIILSITIFTITGCVKNPIVDKENDNINNFEKMKVSDEMVSKIYITIDGIDYIMNLEDNETVKEFINILPKTFIMNELNGNEKYIYLDEKFTINTYSPKTINVGDVMLYGNNCLVIFYKTFNTSYSYTKIGHIDNLQDLGNSNISVEIRK